MNDDSKKAFNKISVHSRSVKKQQAQAFREGRVEDGKRFQLEEEALRLISNNIQAGYSFKTFEEQIDLLQKFR